MTASLERREPRKKPTLGERRILSQIASGLPSPEHATSEVLRKFFPYHLLKYNKVRVASDNTRKVILAEIDAGSIDTDLVLTGVNSDRFNSLPQNVTDYFTFLDRGMLSGILLDFPTLKTNALEILTEQYLKDLGVRNETHAAAVWKILQIQQAAASTSPPNSSSQ